MTNCSALPSGQHAKIVDIQADRHLRTRLQALGVRVGLDVQVVRRAPMGCPIEISVRNVHLALRKQDASAIIVKRDAA